MLGLVQSTVLITLSSRNNFIFELSMYIMYVCVCVCVCGLLEYDVNYFCM